MLHPRFLLRWRRRLHIRLRRLGEIHVAGCFDELWGYTSERARRLWDEMITSPARKISCRLTTTYAGFTGESVLLEELRRTFTACSATRRPAHACTPSTCSCSRLRTCAASSWSVV